MSSGIPAYGKELHAVGHARLSYWVVFLLLFTVILFFLAITLQASRHSLFEVLLGMLFVVGVAILLVAYSTKNRDGSALVVYEKGLWYAYPQYTGTFIPWDEINDVKLRQLRTKGRIYYHLVIMPKDNNKWWGEVSCFRKLFLFYERYIWGSHMCVRITNGLDIEPEELLSIVESRLKQYRQSHPRVHRSQLTA